MSEAVEEQPETEAEAVPSNDLLIIDEESLTAEETPTEEVPAEAEEQSGLIETEADGEEADTELAEESKAVGRNLTIYLLPGDLGEKLEGLENAKKTIDRTAGDRALKVPFDPFGAATYALNPVLRYTGDDGTVTELRKGYDYTIDYENASHASDIAHSKYAKLTIKFVPGSICGNLADCEVIYVVEPYDIGQYGAVDVKYKADATYVYNGEYQFPDGLEVLVASGSRTQALEYGKDYVVRAKGGCNLKDAGDQEVEIIGSGDYTGTIGPEVNGIQYKIEKASVEDSILLGKGLVYFQDAYYQNSDLDSDNKTALRKTIFGDITKNVKDTLKKNTEGGYMVVDPEYYTITMGSATLDSFDDLSDEMLAPGEHTYQVTFNGSKTIPYANYKEGSVTGTYTIKDQSTIEAIFHSEQAGIVKKLETLAYNGLDQGSSVSKIIKDGFEEFNLMHGYAYSRKIDVTVPKEMKNAGDYTVTIRASADSGWSEPYEAKVTIARRQMAKGNPAGEAIADLDITVTQYKYPNGVLAEPVIDIRDNGLGGNLHGKQIELIKGTDFTWKWDVAEDGTRKAFITGLGNYKSTQIIGGKEQDTEIIETFAPTGKVDLDSTLITASLKAGKDLSYNGKPIVFEASEIEVKENINGTLTTVDPSNYHISGYDTLDSAPSSAGRHWLEITAANDQYTGSRKIYYEIIGVPFSSLFKLKEDIPDQEVLALVNLPIPTVAYLTSPDTSLSEENYTYDFYAVEADGSIDWEQPLPKGQEKDDRSILISFPKVGPYRLVFTPKAGALEMEGISGSLTLDFEVKSRKLDKKYILVTCSPNAIIWAGAPVTLEDFKLVVKDGGLQETKTLLKEEDYTAELSKSDQLGYATLKLTGMGNYTDSLTYETTVRIDPRSFTYNMDGFKTKAIVKPQPYSGGDKIIIDSKDVSVYLENETGVKRRVDPGEYTVDCAASSAAKGFEVGADVTVTVTAKDNGHYRGTYQVPGTVKVVAANIKDNSVFTVEGVENKVFNGSAQTQSKEKIKLIDIRTKKAVDPSKYTIAGYDKNTDVGTAAVILKAVDGSGYTGERRVEFKIGKIGLAKLEVTPVSLVYDGKAKTVASGAITVKVLDSNGGVVPADQYDINYKNDTVRAGTVTVVATAKGASESYTGSAQGTFTIAKAANTVTASVSSVEIGKTTKITAKGIGTLTYTSANTAVATVSADGTVTGKAAGTAVITVAAAGDQNHKAGSATVTVTVTAPKQKPAGKVTASGVKKVYKAKKQSFKLPASALGNARLSFKSDSKSITVNAATGMVTVKAGYIGTAKITITAEETASYKKATKTVTVTVNPTATTLKSVTSKNGKITVKWAKKKIATGFQLQYATDKKFTKDKGKIRVKSAGATSNTPKKTFAKGKTYYVRIRVYRSDKGKTLYSKWSAAKKVKIK